MEGHRLETFGLEQYGRMSDNVSTLITRLSALCDNLNNLAIFRYSHYDWATPPTPPTGDAVCRTSYSRAWASRSWTSYGSLTPSQ